MIKDFLRKRIEKNAIKSNLSYTKRDGTLVNEEVIIKRSSMPFIGDWGRVYPPMDENGKILWSNVLFGGSKNFIKLVAIFIIIILAFQFFIGIGNVNKKYLNGNNYVIIEKDLYNQYCKTSIDQAGLSLKDMGNFSIIELNNSEG